MVCIALPLRYLAPRDQGRRARGRYATFFAALGMGYLGLEIALIQKFGLYLGHANYALSVVLAPLLFATGVGALLSPVVLRTSAHVRYASYSLIGVVLLALLAYAAIFPLLGSASPLALGLRALIVVALVMPVGVCLGLFFLAGLERLKAEHPTVVPWAWGINGIFSVLAPILAVTVSITWGISALTGLRCGNALTWVSSTAILPRHERSTSLCID